MAKCSCELIVRTVITLMKNFFLLQNGLLKLCYKCRLLEILTLLKRNENLSKYRMIKSMN